MPEGLVQAHQGMLGGAVEAHARDGQHTGGGRYIDDVAIVSFHHVRHKGLEHPEGAHEVDLDLFAVFVVGQ